MLFMLAGEFKIKDRDAVEKRFLEKGVVPPEGIKVIGQWSAPKQRSFQVVETDDYILLGRWVHEWSDIVNVDIIPINTFEDSVKILSP